MIYHFRVGALSGAQFEWYREHVYYARLKESFGTGFYFFNYSAPHSQALRASLMLNSYHIF